MIAAIYARKSTDQGAVSDEQKSVARQVEHARAFAAARGWTVDDAHIYVDDGISGAEFDRRPAFLRLMNALKPRAPFQMLVMSEESRLGREAIATAYALKQLIQAGVHVWFYMEGRQRTLDSPTDKIMLSLTAFADELEREKGRQRTYDAMQRKAKAGHVTGGRVFGYSNVEVTGPEGRRSHVIRRIDDAEAEVVRDIFARCAAGEGLTRITKALNAAGVPAPRPQQGRPIAWAASSVREVLLRPLYRGEIVWNQTRKRDAWGQQRPQARPAGEWLRQDAPELRIVPEALWQAAHAQMATRRARCGLPGAPRPDRESRYLLTGFATCAACGGPLAAHTRSHGQRRAAFYGCLTFWKKGGSRCGNNLAARMETVDHAVLSALEGDIMRPAVVERALQLAVEALAPGGSEEARHAAAQAEVDALEAEYARLAGAIARGGHLEALLEALDERQARLTTAKAALAALAPQRRVAFNVTAAQRTLRRRLEDWRCLLLRDTQGARDVLRTLLDGPLSFRPDTADGRRGYHFTGAIALERMIGGEVALPTRMASPNGIAHLYVLTGAANRRAA